IPPCFINKEFVLVISSDNQFVFVKEGSEKVKGVDIGTTISVLRRPKERRTRLVGLALRCTEVVFSFLSFDIMASNNQGTKGLRFDDYDEYKYSIAVAVIAFVYVAAQLGRGIYDELFAHNLFPKIVFNYIDFVGDQVTTDQIYQKLPFQVLAYLLLSSSSAAASTTNRLWDNGNMRFTDMVAASVTMSFITFALMAASSVLSGYALSKRIR
ncbi:hypothetical protein KI387_040372, partial [Taxus chinensis]